MRNKETIDIMLEELQAIQSIANMRNPRIERLVRLVGTEEQRDELRDYINNVNLHSELVEEIDNFLNMPINN